MILSINSTNYANEMLMSYLVADIIEKTKDNLADLRDTDITIYNLRIQSGGQSRIDPDDTRVLFRLFDVILLNTD